jgi:hypothetical protein
MYAGADHNPDGAYDEVGEILGLGGLSFAAALAYALPPAGLRLLFEFGLVATGRRRQRRPAADCHSPGQAPWLRQGASVVAVVVAITLPAVAPWVRQSSFSLLFGGAMVLAGLFGAWWWEALRAEVWPRKRLSPR